MKTTVAVLYGCSSVEHEVSIISAVQAMQNMNKEKYNIVPIYVSKSGEMYTGDCLFSIDTYKNFEKLFKICHRVALVKENGKVIMKYLSKKMFHKLKDIEINVGFPIVHGTNCEDGSVAGFFEMLGLAYVGCDVLSAALGMDKSKFKTVLQENNLPVLPCIQFTAREWASDNKNITKEIFEKIKYPAIVKPVNLGSSVGISKVETEEELTDAINLSFSFSDNILVEKAIVNLRELNCSVLGDKDFCEASAIEKPIMHDKILSYEDKYLSGGSKKTEGSKGMASLGRELPAKISKEKSLEIQEIAKKTFRSFGASGVCRIDFLMDTADNNKIYVNEANTIPGSLSFYLWEATGIKYTELIDKLIDLAFKRQRNRDNLMFTINTNILAGANLGGTKGSKSTKL